MAITKVYTKTGDKGMTSLIGGVRVKKTHPRIEAYGTVDELSSQLGLLASFMKDGDDKNLIIRIQRVLFTISSYLATDKSQTELAPSFTLATGEVTILENEIDHLLGSLPQQTAFILPGGCHEAAETTAGCSKRCWCCCPFFLKAFLFFQKKTHNTKPIFHIHPPNPPPFNRQRCPEGGAGGGWR